MWDVIKWFGAICFLIATVILLSPKIAATSSIPWIVFLLGNIAWVADMIRTNNTPWVVVGVIFVALDVAFIWARMVAFNIEHYIQPLLEVMEKMI